MNQRIGIKYLRNNNDGGIDVHSTKGVISNVHRNVIRCAFGEPDVEYLLKTQHDESGCFTVTPHEYQDFFQNAL